MPSHLFRARLLLVAAACLAIAALPASAADCNPPGPAPAIPDGATATVDQMKQAHGDVQSYVNLLQSYQDCLEARIKLTMKTSKPEDLQKLRDAGNAAIDQAKQLSDNYKAQVTAFKARSAK
jgi:hypothetical protein